jgi:hypothetical protein
VSALFIPALNDGVFRAKVINADIEIALEELYGGMELPRGKLLLRIDDGL